MAAPLLCRFGDPNRDKNQDLYIENFPELKKTLPSGYEYHLCSYKDDGDGRYIADIRVAVNSPSRAEQWLNDYQVESKVTLRVSATKPLSGRVNLFACYYRCQHNTIPRTSTADQRQGSKNTNCPAQVAVKVKRYLKKSKAKEVDLHLPKFPMKVTIQHTHNHVIYCADALKHRDVSSETVEKFKVLFAKGHSPGSALNTYKLDLQLQYGPDYVLEAADRLLWS